jgi:hypothetical protein
MAISLSSIKRSGKPKPPSVLLYGVHGIGKTSFGACAPKPIFIQTEDGLGSIETDTFGVLKTYGEIMDAIGTLYNDERDFKTVVLDSADWFEPIVWAETCRVNGWTAIDDGSKETAYGKGYAAALDTWKVAIDGLTALRDDRGMGVIILAHSEIRRFEAPDTEPYDRYQPKLHKGASAILQEAMDCVLFCNYRVNTVKTDAGFNKRIVRGVGSGERLIYTTERPAFLAKNRWSLPDSLPLSWDVFAAGIPYYASQHVSIAAE